MLPVRPIDYGLRDYNVAGQIGLEETSAAYVARIVAVFRECRRVLKDDGVVFLNLGDSYYSNPGNGRGGCSTLGGGKPHLSGARRVNTCGDLKPKDLIGIPWRVAFALQEDGWWLRSDIIWSKPNPMPESVTDRPTKAHEYIFLLAKSERYYYDHEAIKEKMKYTGLVGQDESGYKDAKKYNGKNSERHTDKQRGHGRRHAGFNDRWDSMTKEEQGANGRNKRSVWTVATQSYSGAHFATWPEKLVEPMILAGSRPGDIVLDPFSGSGTTGRVAIRLQRRYVGVELNPAYIALSHERMSRVQIAMVDA